VEVLPTWVDAASGIKLESSKSLTARIRNASKEEQSGKLAVIASGLDGRLVERPLRAFRLAPGATEEVSVPLSSLPIQSQSSASFVVIEAQLERRDGFIGRVSTPPLYYVFSEAYQGVTLYSADDVTTKLNVDPVQQSRIAGRVLETDGRWVDVEPFGAKAAAGGNAARVGTTSARLGPALAAIPSSDAAIAGAAAGEETAAAETFDIVRVCGTWRVQYIDSGFGEDDLATSAWQDVPARFASARVLGPTGNTVHSAYLDINGCTPFLSLPRGGVYTFELETAAFVTPGNIFWRVFQTVGGTQQFTKTSVPFTASHGAFEVLTLRPTFNNDAIQAAAIVSQMLGRHAAGPLYGGADMGIGPGTYTVNVNEACSTGGSCYKTDTRTVHIASTMNLGTPASHWKHVIAHEFGHAVQHFAMGSPAAHYDDVAIGANEAVCRCDHYGTEYSNTLHCLQSREITGAAQKEGFAHAFATRVFNSWVEPNATFVYYKPVLTYGISYPPVPTAIFNEYRWMENFCPAEGRGVELDWLTFFYRVSSEGAPNYTSFKRLWDIYRRTCTGSTTGNCSGQEVQWGNLLANALAYYGGSSTNPSFVRFRNTGMTQGVDH
jgi:hypothetical protein